MNTTKYRDDMVSHMVNTWIHQREDWLDKLIDDMHMQDLPRGIIERIMECGYYAGAYTMMDEYEE